jgi:5-(carboxyamino)imidazole ribonucleotide synthase
LEFAQDKAAMRARLSALGVPCPAWRVVATPQELADFAAETGWPVIAKTSRGGYDGKGVWKLARSAGGRGPVRRAAARARPHRARHRGGRAGRRRHRRRGVHPVHPGTVGAGRSPARRRGGRLPGDRDGPARRDLPRDDHPRTRPDAARAAALEALGRRIADELGVVGSWPWS